MQAEFCNRYGKQTLQENSCKNYTYNNPYDRSHLKQSKFSFQFNENKYKAHNVKAMEYYISPYFQ